MSNSSNELPNQFNLREKEEQMKKISKIIQEKYPLSIKSQEKGVIVFRDAQEIQQLMNAEKDTEQRTTSGRGGNNVSENVKKAIRSLFRKVLPEHICAEYEQRFINHYHLKSQKENYILYFLFLVILKAQRKVNEQTIELLIGEIRAKIQKYTENSKERKEIEPERRQFHSKNQREFSKFLDIDLDFSRPRNYAEVKESIRRFYLKKKAVYHQAEQKVRRIIEEYPILVQIFVDWKEEAQSPLPQQSESSAYEQQSNSNQSSLSP